MSDKSSSIQLQLEQARLRPDIQALREYGQAHPETWVAVKYENEPSVGVVALLFGDDDDIAEHERALRRLVPHPDRLGVVRSAWPLSHLEEIRAEVHRVMTEQPGSVHQVGLGFGIVGASLRADQEPLAHELQGRYGAALRLTVGFMPFPIDRMLTAHEGRMQQLLDHPRPIVPPVLVPGLEATLELTDAVVIAGRDGQGQVLLHNAGDTTREIRGGQPLVGRVTNPSSEETVGGYAGAIPLIGLRMFLEPGEQRRTRVVFGTACTRFGDGYALAPGRYLVKTYVSVADSGVLAVPAAELTVASA